MDSVMDNEMVLRIGIFATVLVLCATAEVIWPRRPRTLSRWQRWPGNLGITLLNTLLLRLLVPGAATGISIWVNSQSIGLFNFLALPASIAIVISFLFLDLVIYFQHRVSHTMPWFWRLHRMHHADMDLDVSSGSRFHPVEILISIAIKAVAIVLIGAPVIAVLVFEICLSSTAMFNHSCIRIPPGVDRWLRWITVTPDMHRVHHSVHHDETDSNFGFNCPWWDRIFGTYIPQPRDGHKSMTIGLEEFRSASDSRLDRLLLQPLR